jgi:hypothetical protein
MRAMVSSRSARTIGLTLAAGLLAFEAVLALSAGAIGIPGVLLVPLAKEVTAASVTGETVIAKLDEVPVAVKRVPQPQAVQPEASAPAGEPNLAGLADIPVDMPWKHDAKPADREDAPRAFSPDAEGREVLPWDAVEPVPPPSQTGSITPAGPQPETPAPEPAPKITPVRLPASGDVEGWVKAKATEIKGEDRGRPLYHFELWLDAPAEVKQRLVAVAYAFNTPAVMPQMQVSSEQKTGFHVSVGGLACADKITITLKFNDGQSQQVAVDGCRLLG